VPPTFILFVYTSYSFQVFGERLACSCQLCVLGAHSPLLGILGFIVCLYTGSLFSFVWNAGFYCLLCVLGAHSPLFGMLGVIVCCVCWELILLCLECWVLLFVVCAGRSFSFVWNAGFYCLFSVLAVCSCLV
jgi:hypothetical protein